VEFVDEEREITVETFILDLRLRPRPAPADGYAARKRLSGISASSA
jgi:hypothetical protein